MALLEKITVYVLLTGLFLFRNNWNKNPIFILVALLSLSVASSASESLLERIEQVEKYERYFKILGDIAQKTRDYPVTQNQYWRVHILRSPADHTEYMLIDPELSSTPINSPLVRSPMSPDTNEAPPFIRSPFWGGSQFFTSWRIEHQSQSLESGPLFERTGLATFKKLSAGGNPFTFRADEEILLSVRMRVQDHQIGDPNPKRRTFTLVSHYNPPLATPPVTTMFNAYHDQNQRFFCHYINSQNSTCEVCVEFKTLEDEKSIHDLRTASHFYDQHPVEKELSGTSPPVLIADDDYQQFLEVFEQNVQGEFLNVYNGMNVDVSSHYQSIGQAHAQVIGRGQFSVVFTLDNVMPGLALRRFPGYLNKRDADNFLLTHEAALKLYRELGVNLEPTRLLLIKAREGYSIYMIQRQLKQDELAESFIEGLLDFGPEAIAMSVKSQDSTGEVYEMGYAEAVSRILHAIITAIYNNLEKMGNEQSAHRIFCDAKPDNFAVRFTYHREWKRNKLYLHDLFTHADLTDFHPCTLVLFDKILFDGGPAAAMLTQILGYNPYQAYQEKIKHWPDAKKLIVKSLANIAYHAGDMAYEIIPELVDRTRLMLLDEWQSNPELNQLYMNYLHQTSTPGEDASKLPLEHLFFDPDEITAESIIQYRNSSSKNNLKLKLHHYLLKLAREMRPERFNHQLYLPVDHQQDWWLRTVDKKYRETFSNALESRFFELQTNETANSESGRLTSESLRTLVNSVAADRTLLDEAKLSQLLNWHVVSSKIPEQATEQRNKHEKDLKRIERDHLIRRVNQFYSSQLQNLHTESGPDSPVATLPVATLPVATLFNDHPNKANEIIEDSLKAFKNGFSKLQQLFWLHLVDEHQPALSKVEQKQLDNLKRDQWIQQVNQRYSDAIRNTLNKAFEHQSFEDKVRLLASDPLLEILSREVLSDPRISLFPGEEISATEQKPKDWAMDEPDFSPLPTKLKKRSSNAISQPSTHIELTQPTADSQLLSTGYSSGTLTRKGLTDLMNKWGIYPMDIVQAEATTFPEAYSQLKSQNWAGALKKLNLVYPPPVYPLPETVRLRFKPRVYERQYLARELRLIPSHDKVQFPSYTYRDTLIQAIKEVMEHRNPSHKPKPLVIIDLSSSVDEMISGAAHHSTPPPSAPRIIVIQSTRSRDGAGELNQVKQVAVPLPLLNQWILENRNYDYLLRVLRVYNDDQWFTLKLPEPVKTQKSKRVKQNKRATYPGRQPSPPWISQPSYTKPVKLENLRLSADEKLGLLHQGIGELSPVKLAQLRVHQATIQTQLRRAEQQAINALKSQWCQIEQVEADHFCLYSSLVHLLNMRPESARKLINHIVALLKNLILTMPYADHGLRGHIVGGLFRNIIFLALNHNATSSHLLFQLRQLLANDTVRANNLLRKLLSQLPEQLTINYRHILNNPNSMSMNELWPLLNQLIAHAGNNTALSLLLADLINQLATLAGQTQHEFLIRDLIQHLDRQWHQNDTVLTSHMLFLGLGAQALDNLMNTPSQTGFQMLHGLMPIQLGQHMWGDTNVLEHLLMPLLQAANTPLNVMIVTPAVHSPQNPLGAMLIQASAGIPALGTVPVPSHDQLEIMQWLHDPDTLTLFHGDLQAPLYPQSTINTGNHWQPVVPAAQSIPFTCATNLMPPVTQPPLTLANTFPDNLPVDFEHLLPSQGRTEAETNLETIHWIHWLVIIMTLVLDSASGS